MASVRRIAGRGSVLLCSKLSHSPPPLPTHELRVWAKGPGSRKLARGKTVGNTQARTCACPSSRASTEKRKRRRRGRRGRSRWQGRENGGRAVERPAGRRTEPKSEMRCSRSCRAQQAELCVSGQPRTSDTARLAEWSSHFVKRDLVWGKRPSSDLQDHRSGALGDLQSRLSQRHRVIVTTTAPSSTHQLSDRLLQAFCQLALSRAGFPMHQIHSTLEPNQDDTRSQAPSSTYLARASRLKIQMSARL